MDLRLLLVADFAKVDASGKLDILGVFQNIQTATYPYTHPMMYIIFGFKPELGEYGDTRTLKLVLVHEDGEELFNLTFPMVVPPLVGGQRKDINGVVGLRDITFPSPGNYEFRVFLDKEQKGALPIEARLIGKVGG